MFINEIRGKEVFDKDANTVGKIADFEVEVPAWTISNIVIKTGLIKKLAIGIDKIDKIGDKVFLKVTKEELLK